MRDRVKIPAILLLASYNQGIDTFLAWAPLKQVIDALPSELSNKLLRYYEEKEEE